ncbi:cytochrome P450 4V2-like [Clytia hemisphaerica]|uniref:Uncharacterized protein n=1 Tax=Clytia hemisphaerica TaxID=252671 RepID=A0A7M5V0L5_9CNID
MWFVYLLTFLVTLITTLYIIWRINIAKFVGIKIAPQHYPIVGSCFHIETEAPKFFKQLRDWVPLNGYLFVIWLFWYPFVWIGKVEVAEAVLKSQDIITKSLVYDFLHPWFGTGLLTSTHQKWKVRRRAITPSFHFNILNEFQKIFITQAEVLAEKFRILADSGESFDVQIPVGLAALDIICETAMGVTINAQSDADSEYVNAINAGNKLLQERQKYPWLWPDFIYWKTGSGKFFREKLNILQGFTTNVINDKVKERGSDQAAEKKAKAFMDMLLDLYEKNEIDIEGIREEVDTFMFEGHDTTAAGLSWTLFMLGLYPEIQQKLHNEIDKVADQEGDLVEKIKSIKYLEYVIKEGLRLHPPVMVYARVLEKAGQIDGITMPKGTQLVIDAFSLHTNPEYWDEPMKFNPERFSEEKYVKRNPYCYVPFSAGPRNCIGQKFAMLEEKVLLYHVLLNFEVVAMQKEEDVAACFEIIHKSENGLMVKLKHRE